jgi:hypothetical protein
MWVVALVLINVLWMNVAKQTAPNEINSAEQFERFREVNVAPVFGTQDALPAVFSTGFSSLSLDQANVSYTIRLNNESVVASWTGLLTDDVPDWEGELAPGTYVVETVVEEGVLTEQVLLLQPFETVQLTGHLVLSLLLVAIAGLEQGVRRFITKNIEATATPATASPAPFKPSSYSEQETLEWNETDSPWREPVR